jgi:hypothetical protein
MGTPGPRAARPPTPERGPVAARATQATPRQGAELARAHRDPAAASGQGLPTPDQCAPGPRTRVCTDASESLMPSLVNSLPRCHSTVRAVMKLWPLISGFDRPSRRAGPICSSCGVSTLRFSGCACAPSRWWRQLRRGRTPNASMPIASKGAPVGRPVDPPGCSQARRVAPTATVNSERKLQSCAQRKAVSHG